MRCSVDMTSSAADELAKVPFHIARKLEYWVNAVETYGIEIVRKRSGYHDEPLKP